MNRLAAAAVLAGAGSVAASALAQTLPAPQFSQPPTADNSARAATTSWVRSQNYLSGVGDLSAASVLAPGSTVARSEAARAATVFNVLDYGAVPDGVTDIAPALNAIAAKLGPAAASNVIYFPAGNYRLASAVTFSGVAPILQGQGFAQGPGPAGAAGTWIKIDQTGFVPITFSGTNARGAKVRDIAFWQVHPAPGAGWAPTAYDYVFKVLNALGEVAFDNVLFAGVNRGIYADNSGRLNIRDVQGQFYTAGVEIDDCYDIPRIERLHAWTFATAAPSVVSYQEANLDTVILRRVDGIFVGDLFSLGARSALRVTSGTNGVTTKFYVSNLYADFVTYGVWIDGAGTNGQIANMTTQNNDQTSPGTTLAGGRGIYVTAPNVGLEIGNFRANSVAGSAIDLESNNARFDISNFWANTYGTPGAGTPAIFAADSGANPSNTVLVHGLPYLQGVAPLYLFNPGVNAGRERDIVMNAVGNDTNELRGYGGAAGNPTSLAAIGGDASVDLQLQAKSATGSVRLQSNGVTVLRVDDAASGTDGMLLRSGGNSLNHIAEGGDANIDHVLTPKGTAGGVRLQANGLTVLREDNPNGGDTDILVRPGTGTVSMVAESASASADVYVTAKGVAGSIRMQANNLTTMRTDNPSGGDSDLLIRSGTAVVALTAESLSASANIALNPKGTGVVTAPTPATTDNSTTVATTAFVKALVGTQTVAAVASGASYTVAANVSRVILASGAATTFALTLPAGPPDNQVVVLECDQATTLTVAASTGQSTRGVPGACSATQGHQFRYRSADTSWRMDF